MTNQTGDNVSREVEANTRLVKLHLQWPDRRQHIGSEQEAIEFFKYLFLNFHMDRDVTALESVDDIEAFLEKNRRLLTAKPAVKKAKPSNARIEPRIASDAHVEIKVEIKVEINNVVIGVMTNVDECEGATQIGVTSSGRALDVGLHGLQINIDHDVPKGSQVALTIKTEAGDSYELEAVTKWSRANEGGQLVGLRILETGGFAAWQADFGAKFVAPRLARHNQPRIQVAK
ncbi:MAG: hypothetical protein ACI82A_003503 [Candidatus Azotimanducaceae bacterium]